MIIFGSRYGCPSIESIPSSVLALKAPGCHNLPRAFPCGSHVARSSELYTETPPPSTCPCTLYSPNKKNFPDSSSTVTHPACAFTRSPLVSRHRAPGTIHFAFANPAANKRRAESPGICIMAIRVAGAVFQLQKLQLFNMIMAKTVPDLFTPNPGTLRGSASLLSKVIIALLQSVRALFGFGCSCRRNCVRGVGRRVLPWVCIEERLVRSGLYWYVTSGVCRIME